MGHLVSVDFSKRPLSLNLGKETVHTRTLIIASGASARWLGLPSEQALIGHGVSSCATCDGFFFSGKEIAVIGGGDSAMEEALFLTRFASKVTLIHRREQFRSSRIMLERAMAHDKIKFLTNTAVEEVLGVEQKEVSGLRLKNTLNHEESTLPVSAMFLGIGHIPNAKMFRGLLDLDDDGYIRTTDQVFTRVPGVFACGDVQDRRYRQAITAAGRAAWPLWKWKNSLKNTAIEDDRVSDAARELSPCWGKISSASKPRSPWPAARLGGHGRRSPSWRCRRCILLRRSSQQRRWVSGSSGKTGCRSFRRRAFSSGLPVSGAEFHLIGHLQSNKAARAAELFSSIDTLDSFRWPNASTRLRPGWGGGWRC